MKIACLALVFLLNAQIVLAKDRPTGGSFKNIAENHLNQIKTWRPTSANLLEISSITLSTLLIFFIIGISKSNRDLRKHKAKLEEQYKTLLRIKKDVRAGKKFELATESASDQIVITDPDGIILYANPALEKISGFRVTKVLGKKAGSKSLWGGQMSHSFYKDFWHTIKEQKKSFKGTFENKRKDGTKYYAQATVSPILDENNGIQFFIGIERDITKEKEIDKMKDEFISLASHQLRTPLSSIRWYLEMLVDGDAGELTVEQQKYAKNVYESAKRMINLVNALLNVSRIESGRVIVDPTPTDIVELIKEVVEETKAKLGDKNQKILLSAYKKLPLIKIDQKLLRNVYLNLITNAMIYSPPQSTIEIFISKNENELISQITDHGYGIPKMEHKKVFEKFFRASNAMKVEPSGTGLGLYLSKTIVESSGGSIWFDSDENGTSFWFTIPLKGMEAKKGEVTIDS